MRRLRALWWNAQQEWPRWAQVGGILLGTWQILEWKLAGSEPNAGVMGFAASLLLFQRARSAKRRRESDE